MWDRVDGVLDGARNEFRRVVGGADAAMPPPLKFSSYEVMLRRRSGPLLLPFIGPCIQELLARGEQLPRVRALAPQLVALLARLEVSVRPFGRVHHCPLLPHQ